MAKKKGPNEALVEFVVKARKKGMTYREAQIQETLELIKEQKAAAERLAKRKGGGTDGCKEVSSAGQQTEQAD